VIHSAATVRFDHTLDEARAHQRRRHAPRAGLCRRRAQLRSLAYVGTAYVAGERTGLVREERARRRARATATPTSRPRPRPRRWCARAGIHARRDSAAQHHCGRLANRRTSSFKMMYWPLKIYARGLWRTVPGYPDAVLDIVPVDYVATAVARLAFDPAALGSRCAPLRRPARQRHHQQIARRAAEYFHAPEARYVDPKLFFAAVRPLLFMTLWGRKRRVLRDGRAYRDYFTMRMQFDTTNAERLLGPAGVRPPPVLDYLDRLFTTAWPATGAASRSPPNEYLPSLSALARPLGHGCQPCRRTAAAQRRLRGLR
jgi:hypothetical protein